MKNFTNMEQPKEKLESSIGRATCIKVSRNKYVGIYGATKELDIDRLVSISEGAILHKVNPIDED